MARLAALVVVPLLSVAACAPEVQTGPDNALALQDERIAQFARPMARGNKCIQKWTPDCATVQEELPGDDCGFGALCYRIRWQSPAVCMRNKRLDCTDYRSYLHASQAHGTCDEGSVDECRAACDGGHAYTCLLLAQMYRSGARVGKDGVRATAIATQACQAGATDSCAAAALWLRSTDPGQSATLAMRACGSQDRASAAVGCALWMQLVDAHAVAPTTDERIAGLTLICGREQSGELTPGMLGEEGGELSAVVDFSRPSRRVMDDITRADDGAGALKIEFAGGACGRLKDLPSRR